MCEYAILKEGYKDVVVCRATNMLCTLCVLGNAKTYNEAKAKERGETAGWFLFDRHSNGRFIKITEEGEK